MRECKTRHYLFLHALSSISRMNMCSCVNDTTFVCRPPGVKPPVSAVCVCIKDQCWHNILIYFSAQRRLYQDNMALAQGRLYHEVMMIVIDGKLY